MITGEPSEAYDKQRRTREIVDLLFYTLPVSGLELDWMCGLLGAPGSETLSSVVPKETSKQVIIYRHMRTLRRYEVVQIWM
ncbi:hypothetical protein Y032_0077g1133 [Ancylostoma ceylanicum]|uniref:Uncharacterized protein n=1 Tax=Ancylostoma ceylanicum TaxID=53326 RepID=A0A016TV86_9BILA|nr:hypothetical protein Y032_0077g1133 [Ancylostoma ceylanicum]